MIRSSPACSRKNFVIPPLSITHLNIILNKLGDAVSEFDRDPAYCRLNEAEIQRGKLKAGLALHIVSVQDASGKNVDLTAPTMGSCFSSLTSHHSGKLLQVAL